MNWGETGLFVVRLKISIKYQDSSIKRRFEGLRVWVQAIPAQNLSALLNFGFRRVLFRCRILFNSSSSFFHDEKPARRRASIRKKSPA